MKPYRGKPDVRNFREGGWKRDLRWKCEPTSQTERTRLETLHLRVRAASALPDNGSNSALQEPRGRIRRVMIVALARKLLLALWRFSETGLVPTGARLA